MSWSLVFLGGIAAVAGVALGITQGSSDTAGLTFAAGMVAMGAGSAAIHDRARER